MHTGGKGNALDRSRRVVCDLFLFILIKCVACCFDAVRFALAAVWCSTFAHEFRCAELRVDECFNILHIPTNEFVLKADVFFILLSYLIRFCLYSPT